MFTPGGLGAPKPSAVARRQLPEGTRLTANQEARFARDITQDAQRHTGLSTCFYRAANSIDGPFYSFGNFRDGGFPFWNGVKPS
jgi:hypothetical protein